MKHYILLFTFLLTASLQAQTYIALDTLEGIFTKANSPYIITRNALVIPYTKLTIEPGVRLEFLADVRLTIQGSLCAEGTETDSIYFTSHSPDSTWEGIRILHTNRIDEDSTKIAYAVFSRTLQLYKIGSGRIYGGALTLINTAKIFLHNVLFTENLGASTNFDTLQAVSMSVKNSVLEMRDILFKKNFGIDSGITITSRINLRCENSILRLKNITIDSCYSTDMPGFALNNCTADIENITVQNCSTYYQISFGTIGEIEGGNYKVSGLKAYNNTGEFGLAIQQVDSSSIFANMDISGNHMTRQSSALIYKGKERVTFYNCNITRNSGSGFYITNSGHSHKNNVNLINCVISDNDRYGIEQHDLAPDSLSMNIINCIVWGNNLNGIKLSSPGKADVNVYYSNLQYPWNEVDIMDGVTHSSPEFRNPSTNDYHLSSSSALIDKGDPSPIYNDRVMGYLAGQKTARNDMGSYGGIFNEWNSNIVANFTASANFGKPPLAVTFNDRSINGPTKWEWDFNNDGFSDSYEQNPSFIFTEPGTYSVRLIASKRGSADTLILHNLITVPTEKVIGAVYGRWVYDTITVLGDIFVPKDSTLTIEPGTTVHVAGDYRFDVFGNLQSLGTASKKISFYADSLFMNNGNYAGWRGISFFQTETNNQPVSRLTYTHIRHTTKNALLFENASNVGLRNITIHEFAGDGIKITNSDLEIDSLNMHNGISAKGIYVTDSELLLNKANITRIGDGGGLRAVNSKLNLHYVTFDSNSVRFDGGGAIDAYNCDVFIKGGTISRNSGDGGGGLFVQKGASVRLESVVITNNKATTGAGGGGIFYDCFPEFTNVVVNQNSSYDGGAGLYIGTQQNWQTVHKTVLNNCLITKNVATSSSADGGGLSLGYNVYANITNSTIADNKAQSWGGIYAATVALPHIYKNVIVYNNGPDRNFQAGSGPYLYSLIEGNYNGMDSSTTNLNNILPLLRDTVQGNYHLQSVSSGYFSNSPAIDKGDPSINDFLLGSDFGLGTVRSDIGAYGGQNNRWGSNLNPPCYYQGSVSGLWNCPTIYINGDITVNKGDTLRIAEGTRIVFLGAFSWKVDGVVKAAGTKELPIIITASDTINGWRGMSFHYRDTASVGISDFSNVLFEYAKAIGETTVEGKGGAIYLYRSSNIKIDSCIFKNNYASNLGGAMYISYAKPSITKTVFEKNYAVNAGGGIYFDHADTGTYHLLQFKSNRAKEGAGMFFDHASPNLTNLLCTFNSTTVPGVGTGGAFFFFWSSPRMTNVTAAFNYAGNGGGAVGLSGECNPAIVNSLLALNSKPEFNYNGANYNFYLVYAQVEEGIGQPYFSASCIDAQPYFRNINLQDFHLQSISCGSEINAPGIDAGSPFTSDAQLDCEMGLGTIRSDLGFYGGNYADSISVGVQEQAKNELPTVFELLQNYPNPFNPSTVIGFQLPHASMVTITVYDMLGRELKTLLYQEKAAGSHSITFDGHNLASGVYIYQIRAGAFIAAKKLMLLK